MAITAITAIRATPHRLVVSFTEDNKAGVLYSWDILPAYVAMYNATYGSGAANQPFYQYLSMAHVAQADARTQFNRWYDVILTPKSGTAAPGTSVETRCGFVTYAAPIAEELITVSADAALAADGARVLSAGATAGTVPDVPRGLTFRITIATNPVTAGIARVVGVDASGTTVTEDVNLVTAVSITRYSTRGYASVTSITVIGLTGAGGAGDNLSVGVSSALGLPGCSDPVPASYSGIWTAVAADVDSIPVREAVAGYAATRGLVTPTTVPDGSRVFWFSYTYTLQPNGTTALPTILFDQNIAGAAVGNFRLEMTANKQAIADTAEYILDICFRHSVPL